MADKNNLILYIFWGSNFYYTIVKNTISIFWYITRLQKTVCKKSRNPRNYLCQCETLKTMQNLLLAGVGDRSYRTGSDTEGAATTDNPTTPFPTPPPTLTPNHRQASPFPLENTNSRRHHYNGSISSERSRNGNGAELIRGTSGATFADALARSRLQCRRYLQMSRDETRYVASQPGRRD